MGNEKPRFLKMDNGTIYYGSVIYQDEQYVTIETLIGKLNLERNRIIRVLSHHLEEDEVPAFPEVSLVKAGG